LPATSIDPVCGMTVTTDSPHVHEHHGEPVYFCCAGCKAKFIADPERYIEVAVGVEPMALLTAPSRLLEDTHPAVHAHADGGATAQSHGRGVPVRSPAPPPPGTIYTCPMHPEVRQDGPGACPKCGMALEPELPSVDEADAPELVDFRRRFWWTLPLTVAVAAIAMVGSR
jgi:Cu+-exporting ATPase